MTAAAGDWIIDTDVDAKTTLGRMARLVTRAMTQPPVIYAANQVIGGIPPRATVDQIARITEFLDSYFKFVPNPIGTQTIRPPGWTGNERAPGMLEDIEARGYTQGACDDAAVLAATLGMANGLPARFRALAFSDRNDPMARGSTAPYTHVVCDLLDENTGDWYPLDVTRPLELERPADSDVVRVLTQEIS